MMCKPLCSVWNTLRIAMVEYKASAKPDDQSGWADAHQAKSIAANRATPVNLRDNRCDCMFFPCILRSCFAEATSETQTSLVWIMMLVFSPAVHEADGMRYNAEDQRK